MLHKKIKVLIVDDSTVVRKFLTHLLGSDPQIEVVGAAADPYIAREMIAKNTPDVMTLDIEMPRMDGITFLQKVMQHKPIPTVIISSLSIKGSEIYLNALEVGAVAVLTKPAIDLSRGLADIGKDILSTVKAASTAKVEKQIFQPGKKAVVAPLARTTEQVIVIASSTGGTVALKRVLPHLPSNVCGTVIVQHMPPVFSKSFAKSLDDCCPFDVKEAEEGDRVMPGLALVVPGDYHARIRRSGARYMVALNQEPKMHGVRPAADILFESVAAHIGANAIGVVLTGMGKDGALGLKQMRDAGSYNIAQDEASSVVFGMPKEAIAAEAIHKVVPLDQVAPLLIDQMRRRELA